MIKIMQPRDYRNIIGLRVIPIPGSSAYIADKDLLIMSANSYFSRTWPIGEPELLLLPDMRIEECVRLAKFDGRRNALLQMTTYATFLGLDNRLMMSEDLETWKTVLETENRENMFWHMTEAGNGIFFVQEYGQPSTGIYRSTDGGENWERIVNSKDIDRRSRHFHSVAYDQYRHLLVATLGDGNPVKMVVSNDYGDTWRPVYASAYQCLPIVVSKDFIVFGIDSAISRGVIVWDPSKNKWQCIHLKYVNSPGMTDILQSSDLKLSSNGIWIMSTGGGSLLSSGDLKNWRILHLGGKERFESHMISNEKNGVVAATTGEAVIIIDSKALDDKCQPADVKQYRAFFAGMKGLAYVGKRLLMRL